MGQNGGGATSVSATSAENSGMAEMGGPADSKETSSLALGTTGIVLLKVTWRIPR